MSDNAALDAKVALMAQSFLAKLPARFDKMNAALAQCTLAPDSEPHWIELHRLLHSLAGAAGTFGVGDLGQQAALIEHKIKLKLAQNGWNADDLAEVRGAVLALQSSIPSRGT